METQISVTNVVCIIYNSVHILLNMTGSVIGAILRIPYIYYELSTYNF